MRLETKGEEHTAAEYPSGSPETPMEQMRKMRALHGAI